MTTQFRSLLSGLLLSAALACATALAARSADTEWIADNNGCKVANPSPRAEESITWTGPCRDGFADGTGVLQWYLDGKADDRYEGALDMGWAHGKGVLTRAEGGKYDGDWRDSMQEGIGRFESPDGSAYEGQWRSGKPHGQGQYRAPDGRLFTGEWIDGVFDGHPGGDSDENYDPNRT